MPTGKRKNLCRHAAAVCQRAGQRKHPAHYLRRPGAACRSRIALLHERQSDSLRQQKHQDGNNVLQLAILSRIKLFVRPANLAMPPEEALSQLRFERVGNHLKVSNASPYYVTLVNLKLGGQTLDNLMVAPKSSAQQVLPAAASGTLSWQSVNDYGAITPARSVSL